MQTCVRGCTRRGVHYASCPAYASGDGCDGCALSEARDGALLCNRCYGRLFRMLELIPDLIAHIRSIADPMKVAVYDRVLVSGSGSEVAPAPVSSDLLDAQIDIMHTIGAVALPAGTDSERAYLLAVGAVGDVLRGFDAIAADKTAVLQWWDLVMVGEHPEDAAFWTVARALKRWPLEERRRWAAQPCPECGLKTVRVSPPRREGMPTWFDCKGCKWHRADTDDDGLWAAMFGLYVDESREGHGVADSQAVFVPEPIDMGVAVKAGIRYVVEHPAEVQASGSVGVPVATLVGATPVIAEQFACLAEQLAAHVKANYENGSLIAGGARMVADLIRESAQSAQAPAETEGSGA